MHQTYIDSRCFVSCRAHRCLLTVLISACVLLAHAPTAWSGPCDVPVPGQIFCDDFRDGDFGDDMPVTWRPLESDNLIRIENESLNLRDNDLAVATAKGLNLSDLSMRAQVRLNQRGFIGITSRWDDNIQPPAINGYIGYVNSELGLTAGLGLSGPASLLTEDPIEFDAMQEDVMIQLDVFGDTLSLWVWPANEAMPSGPFVVRTDTRRTAGDVYLFVTGDDQSGPADGDFRFVQVATQHIVPEPLSASLFTAALMFLPHVRPRPRNPWGDHWPRCP